MKMKMSSLFQLAIQSLVEGKLVDNAIFSNSFIKVLLPKIVEIQDLLVAYVGTTKERISKNAMENVSQGVKFVEQNVNMTNAWQRMTQPVLRCLLTKIYMERYCLRIVMDIAFPQAKNAMANVEKHNVGNLPQENVSIPNLKDQINL